MVSLTDRMTYATDAQRGTRSTRTRRVIPGPCLAIVAMRLNCRIAHTQCARDPPDHAISDAMFTEGPSARRHSWCRQRTKSDLPCTDTGISYPRFPSESTPGESKRNALIGQLALPGPLRGVLPTEHHTVLVPKQRGALSFIHEDPQLRSMTSGRGRTGHVESLRDVRSSKRDDFTGGCVLLTAVSRRRRPYLPTERSHPEIVGHADSVVARTAAQRARFVVQLLDQFQDEPARENRAQPSGQTGSASEDPRLAPLQGPPSPRTWARAAHVRGVPVVRQREERDQHTC